MFHDYWYLSLCLHSLWLSQGQACLSSFSLTVEPAQQLLAHIQAAMNQIIFRKIKQLHIQLLVTSHTWKFSHYIIPNIVW